MSDVLILTGPAGVGKTTTATIWSSMKKAAHIQADDFSFLLDEGTFEKWSEEEDKFFAKISAMMALQFLMNGLPVVIEYVWKPYAIEEIRKELFRMKGINVRVVRLTCDLEENENRDKQRTPANQMGERVKILQDEFNEIVWPSFVEELDTTGLFPQQILDKLLGKQDSTEEEKGEEKEGE
ncbi:MAG: hypothetical protein P1U56_06995 [Saprospiraceae bacterium]|nr:hypothetical protein [Saprospiraceae bacterium]